MSTFSRASPCSNSQQSTQARLSRTPARLLVSRHGQVSRRVVHSVSPSARRIAVVARASDRVPAKTCPRTMFDRQPTARKVDFGDGFSDSADETWTSSTVAQSPSLTIATPSPPRKRRRQLDQSSTELRMPPRTHRARLGRFVNERRIQASLHSELVDTETVEHVLDSDDDFEGLLNSLSKNVSFFTQPFDMPMANPYDNYRGIEPTVEQGEVDGMRLPKPASGPDAATNPPRCRRLPALPSPEFEPLPPLLAPTPAQLPPDLLTYRQQHTRGAIQRGGRGHVKRKWTNAEEKEFVRLINIYGKGNWQVMLKVDAGPDGYGLLSERSNQDLKDKARVIHGEMIRSRVPVHPAFQHIIRKEHKRGQELLMKGLLF